MATITSVTCELLSSPFADDGGWTAAHGTSTKRDECIVRVATADGYTGVGEAYHAFSPTVIKEVVDGHLSNILVGRDSREIQPLWEQMFFSAGQLGAAGVAAISGVDIALWDLLGRELGVPIATMFGAAGVTSVATYVGCMCLGFKPVSDLAAEAAAYVRQGYRALKIRGGQGIDADIEAFAHVRQAVGPSVDLMIDANSAYSPPESLKLATLLARYDAFWLEDPFDYTVVYHHGDMAKLSANSPTPIASGGNLYTRFQVRDLLEAGGVHYITPDVTKCGGLSEFNRIASIASAYNIVCAPHTVVGVGTVAAVHAAAAIPAHVRGHLEWDASATNGLRDNLCTPKLQVAEGFVRVPQRPGLGIEISVDTSSEFPFVEGAEISMPPRARRWQPLMSGVGK